MALNVSNKEKKMNIFYIFLYLNISDNLPLHKTLEKLFLEMSMTAEIGSWYKST